MKRIPVFVLVPVPHNARLYFAFLCCEGYWETFIHDSSSAWQSSNNWPIGGTFKASEALAKWGKQ